MEKGRASLLLERIARRVPAYVRAFCLVFIPLLILPIAVVSCMAAAPLLFADTAGMLPVLFSASLPMMACLVALPLLWMRKEDPESAPGLGLHGQSRLACAFALASLGCGVALIVHALAEGNASAVPWGTHLAFVAFSEEFFVRGFLFCELGKGHGPWKTCVLTACIFAFACHSAEPFLVDLVVRLPLGIALGVCRIASGGIWLPCGIHFLYDIFVTFVIGAG